MFLNQIKIFFIKNKIKKRLRNVPIASQSDIIKTIGIIFDETNFEKRDQLINTLVKNGFNHAAISVLVYKDKILKNEIVHKPSFSCNDLNWSGNFENQEVTFFLDQKFDLLINYYEKEKTPLLQATNTSKAIFKVGFAGINKKLNHFIIKTEISEIQIFVDELFKYLKIFKKI